LAQTQSSAKVNKKDWFYPVIYVAIVSDALNDARWRASDEPDLMAHSRRGHRSMPLQANTISRIKTNAPSLAFMT
jgi:hypothetical protein